MERSRRALLAGLTGVFAGCLNPSTDSEAPATGSNTARTANTVTATTAVSPTGGDTPTDTATPAESATTTPTPGTPDYATCDPANVRTPPGVSYPNQPDDLTEERVADYVATLEEAVILPPEDEMTGGWVDMGSVTVEPVVHGFLAYVPVDGGYYNEERDDSTATQHADLPRYTASYFLNDRVVRRASESERVDARESGDVLLCTTV